MRSRAGGGIGAVAVVALGRPDAGRADLHPDQHQDAEQEHAQPGPDVDVDATRLLADLPGLGGDSDFLVDSDVLLARTTDARHRRSGCAHPQQWAVGADVVVGTVDATVGRDARSGRRLWQLTAPYGMNDCC